MRERLKRLVIIALVALLTVGLAKAFSDWQKKQSARGESLTAPIKKKVENLGDKILGEIIGVLPGAPDLEKTMSVGQTNQARPDSARQAGEVQGEQDQTNSEAEPINQPAQTIQKQTEALIETIKELPQDQIEAIKKQIYKDFCERLVQGE